MYGLVNENAIWQRHSDETLLDIGLHALGHIPQVSFLKIGKTLLMVVAKVVDDIREASFEKRRGTLSKGSKPVYTLGTVIHFPRQFKFFGISVSQDANASITICNDDKLQHIAPYC